MVGYEDAAVSASRLLADSISLLGHKVYAGSPKASKPFGCSVFRAGCVRATDSTSNRGQERTTLRRVFGEAIEGVIGNLREGAERFAPGRACISGVSGHGFIEKDFHAMEFIPLASEAQEMLSERDRFLIGEVLHAENCIAFICVGSGGPSFVEPADTGPDSFVARHDRSRFCRQEFQVPFG